MSSVLDEYILMQHKEVMKVDKNMAFPLMRYASGNVKNLDACQFINEGFFEVPSKMIISMLHTKCIFAPFQKYPKGKKIEEESDEALIRTSICKIYKWSNQEYDKNKDLILSMNRQEIAKFINKKIGLDKKESKLLGVEYNVKKYKFEPSKPKPVGLNSFM